jgi:hypothetical protein
MAGSIWKSTNSSKCCSLEVWRDKMSQHCRQRNLEISPIQLFATWGKTGDSPKDQGSIRRDQVDSESRLAKAQKLQIRSR